MDINKVLADIDQLKERLSTLRPLPPVALKKIQDALDIEYTYESNRIEGNTLTLQETALIVNDGITVSGKPLKEHLEAINHAQAIDFIKDIAQQEIGIDERIIKEMHALILHGIDRENAGKYRMVSVLISGSEHLPPPPYLIEEQMKEFIAGFHQKEKQKVHPVLIAAYLHDELVRIHPFIDGNGRTSRLLMNLYLLQHGYVIIVLKSDNDSKVNYYNALEESHIHNHPEPFYLLIAEAEKASLQRYMSLSEF